MEPWLQGLLTRQMSLQSTYIDIPRKELGCLLHGFPLQGKVKREKTYLHIPSSLFSSGLIPKTWCLTRAQGQKDLWQDVGPGLYTEAPLYVSIMKKTDSRGPELAGSRRRAACANLPELKGLDSILLTVAPDWNN